MSSVFSGSSSGSGQTSSAFPKQTNGSESGSGRRTQRPWRKKNNNNNNNNSNNPPNSQGDNHGNRQSAFSQNNVFQKKKKQNQKRPQSTKDLPPTEPGFRPRSYEQRELPTFLASSSLPVVQINRPVDPWDMENQQRMLDVESSTNDMQTMYETLQAMREAERKEMENRGLVDKENTKKRLDQAITFMGSCYEMCPTFERVRRTYENNVKQLEKDPLTGKVTRQFAVKAFSRPAAGQPPPLPSDVRPPPILQKTLFYLIDQVVPKLPTSHSFLWDRTRSIRQDFTYQNYSGPEAIECNEIIVRVHILSLHVMAGSDQEYSQQQELEQMNKALQTLSEFYADARKRGIARPSEREAEMRAYQLISLLRDPDIEQQVQQQLPGELWNDPVMLYALQFRTLLQQNNVTERGYINTENAPNLFVDFFNSLRNDRNIPVLLLCLLESHFNSIRLNALKAMSKSYHSKGKPFSIPRLVSMLGFNDEEEAITFCKHYDMKILSDDNIPCVDLTSISLERVANAKPLPQAFSKYITERAKFQGSFQDILYAGLSKSGSANNFTNSFSVATSQPAQKTSPPLFEQKNNFAFQKPESEATHSTTSTIPEFVFGQAKNSISSPAFVKQKVEPLSTASVLPKVPTTQTSPAFPSFAKQESVRPPTVLLNTKEDTATTKPTTSSVQKPLAHVTAPSDLTPKDIVSSPPKKRIPVYQEWELKQACDRVVNDTVHSLLSEMVNKSWSQIKERRELRSRTIDYLASDITKTVLKEIYDSAVKESLADAMYAKCLKIRALEKIRGSMNFAKKKQQEAENRRLEFLEVTQNMENLHGGDLRDQVIRRRKRSDVGDGLSMRKRHPRGVEDQFDIAEKARRHLEEVWSPLDISKLLIPKLRRAFNATGQNGEAHITVAVYCNDWETTTIGAWVQSKLGLGPSVDKRSLESILNISCTVMKLYNDANTFKDIGLLIYVVTGELTKEEYIGQIGYLMNAVSKESKIQMSVIVLSWGLSVAQASSIGSEAFANYEGDDIEQVLVCAMSDPPDEDGLAETLTRWADMYVPELSKYGVAQRQKEEDELAKRQYDQKRKERIQKELNQERARKEAMDKIHSLRILQTVGKRSSTRATTGAGSQQEPQSSSLDSRNGPTTENIPKSILELKNLVDGVRESLLNEHGSGKLH